MGIEDVKNDACELVCPEILFHECNATILNMHLISTIPAWEICQRVRGAMGQFLYQSASGNAQLNKECDSLPQSGYHFFHHGLDLPKNYKPFTIEFDWEPIPIVRLRAFGISEFIFGQFQSAFIAGLRQFNAGTGSKPINLKPHKIETKMNLNMPKSKANYSSLRIQTLTPSVQRNENTHVFNLNALLKNVYEDACLLIQKKLTHRQHANAMKIIELASEHAELVGFEEVTFYQSAKRNGQKKPRLETGVLFAIRLEDPTPFVINLFELASVLHVGGRTSFGYGRLHIHKMD